MPIELYNTDGEIVSYGGKYNYVTKQMSDYFERFIKGNIPSSSSIEVLIHNGIMPTLDFFIERKLPENDRHKEMSVICGVSYLVNQIDGRISGYNIFKYEPTRDGTLTARELMHEKHPFPKDIINSSKEGFNLSFWSEYEKIFPEIKQIVSATAHSLALDSGNKDGYSSLKNQYILLKTRSYIGDEQKYIFDHFDSLKKRFGALGCCEKIYYKENKINFLLDNGVSDYVMSLNGRLEYNGIFFDSVSSFLGKYLSRDGIDKKGIAFEKWYGKDPVFREKNYHPFFERPWDFCKQFEEVVELLDQFPLEKYDTVDMEQDDMER